ncbi:MAG TPA: HemK2/MTQ2 family protein methyltransferase [Chitinophagaceae bacterium]
MRTAIKHIVAWTYKPLLVKYLSKTRQYQQNGISLEISSQVFHPGFFFSTQLLLQYVSNLSLEGKSFLELGAGSGLIAMQAAKKQAKVTASDINPVAIEYLKKNSSKNNIRLDIIQSDLFAEIQEQVFDIIAINPPYYKKQPQSLLDHAWFCGENGEYFDQLFKQLPSYINESTAVIMVLCDGCDIEMIKGFAEKNKFSLRLLQTKQSILEKNFVFKIEKAG